MRVLTVVLANSLTDLVPYDENDDDLQNISSYLFCEPEDAQTGETNPPESVSQPSETAAHLNDEQEGKVPEFIPSETLSVSIENCDVLQQRLIQSLDHFKGDTRNTVLRYLADVIEPSNGTRKSFTKGEKKSNDVLWLWDEDRLGPPPAGTNIRSRLRKESKCSRIVIASGAQQTDANQMHGLSVRTFCYCQCWTLQGIIVSARFWVPGKILQSRLGRSTGSRNSGTW